MLRLNILLALRNIKKNKLYSITNILGLAIGIFSFSCIYMYNWHESNFDTFHAKADNIYRLWDMFESSQRKSAMMPYKWTEHLAAEFPEIESATSIQITNMVVKEDDQVWNESKVIAADTGFFKIFDFPVLKGNKNEFFKNPRGIILERQTALKYYNSTDEAMGKTLNIGLSGQFMTFQIEGVVECPKNSHIQFDYLIPYDPVIQTSFNPSAYESFSTHFVYTYVHIPNPFEVNSLQKNFKEFLKRHGNERLMNKYTTYFHPFLEVYLNSEQDFDFDPRGSGRNVDILSIVAILVMIMAAVNFVNLTTAKSMKRMKEVSIRKVFGSSRSRLVYQFLVESILISLMAYVIALLSMILFLPAINVLSGVEFELIDIFQTGNIVITAIISVLVGILAGAYPAILISSFGTLSILKSNDHPGSVGSLARKGLMVIQFAIAGFLIVATLVVSKQLDFMINKDLGIETEQVLLIEDRSAISNDRDKILLLRNELASDDVVSVTTTSTYPGVPTWAVGFLPEGHKDQVSYQCMFTDHDFVKTYDIQIVQGRDLNIRMTSDSVGFLINEKARDHFATYDSSWLVDPIGKNIKSRYLKMEGPVIGVMEDFHYESVHFEIRPLIVMVYPRLKSCVQIRLKTKNLKSTLNKVETVWAKLNPSIPFEVRFIDDIFSESFRSDQQLADLFRIFSAITISLAMVGLFGLTSFLTKEQLKSSSIKKVLGASIQQITIDLLKPIAVLLLIALTLALPLSHYLSDLWLDEFPYRIELSPLVIMGSMLLLLVISFITISYHTFKLVRTNPVKVLRQD